MLLLPQLGSLVACLELQYEIANGKNIILQDGTQIEDKTSRLDCSTGSYGRFWLKAYALRGKVSRYGPNRSYALINGATKAMPKTDSC